MYNPRSHAGPESSIVTLFAMILIIHAHPYPTHSRACRVLLDAVRDLPDVEVRSLYDLYPNFDIDIAAEQGALLRAGLVVWLHPIYWYSVPAMQKHWFDVVLLRGWAYGKDGKQLCAIQRIANCVWQCVLHVAMFAGMKSFEGRLGMHEHKSIRKQMVRYHDMVGWQCCALLGMLFAITKCTLVISMDGCSGA